MVLAGAAKYTLEPRLRNLRLAVRPRQDLIECVRQSLPRIRLYPDAAEVLSGLRDSCLLAVVADGPLAGQQPKGSFACPSPEPLHHL